VSWREHRLAENESHFRGANERIKQRAREALLVEELVPFLCECPDADCDGRVMLSLSQYERVRSDGELFVVLAGHERLEIEHVVERGDTYVVVRKDGEAGEVAADLDPRS
jgi:hypothetical protein